MAHIASLSGLIPLQGAGTCPHTDCRFAFPLPVFLDEDTAVVDTPAQAERLLHRLRAVFRARGYRTVTPRLVSVEIPRNGRFRLWVDWIGQGGTGDQTLFRTVCFNHGTLEDNVTHMIRVEGLAARRTANRRKAG